MTFGYDADIVGWQMASSNGVRKHGMSLAYAILGQRRSAELMDRPLIFVAHSLGGLVSEQAFLLCRDIEELQPIFQNTRGFLSLGTPHDGSPHAAYASGFAAFVNIFRRSNRDLLKALDAQSEVSRAVEEDWYNVVTQKNGFIRVHCFAEAIAKNLVGKIVHENSAVLKGFPYNTIHADHSGMTKFANANDEGYGLVTDVLKRWIGEFTVFQENSETSSKQELAASSERQKEAQANRESSSQRGKSTDASAGATITNNGPINAKTVFQGITANNGTFTF
jgi:hypothetical protein